jgi:hypothetical protein
MNVSMIGDVMSQIGRVRALPGRDLDYERRVT